jgi:hypothetical protein
VEKNVLEKMAERVNNTDAVAPGQPARFTEACVPGDRIAQGDLNLTVVDEVPNGYVLVKKPTEADRQLVPGNTEGARHCLDSLDGVRVYRPDVWTEDGIDGPCLVLSQERTVEHPKHGHVTVPAGFTILCTYQRVWDKEQARARRAID